MGTLRNHLAQRARGGDMAALDVLIDALPAELPPAIRRAERDERIRVLGRALAAAIPGASTHAIAQMIASAGAALDRGHRTAARELPMLTGAELAVVESEMLAVLEWLPIHHDGARWPRARQVFAILHH